MLKKEYRMTSRYEFNVTRKFGDKINGKFFYMYFLKRDASDGKKVGIIVSKKFSKSAPVRNRVKRVYREVIKNNLDLIPDSYWVVIYPKSESLKIKYEEINSDFTKVLQKIFVTG